jgi:hypothetical protein
MSIVFDFADIAARVKRPNHKPVSLEQAETDRRPGLVPISGAFLNEYDRNRAAVYWVGTGGFYAYNGTGVEMISLGTEDLPTIDDMKRQYRELFEREDVRKISELRDQLDREGM